MYTSFRCEEAEEKRKPHNGRHNREHDLQPLHVCIDDGRHEFFRKSGANLRGTSEDDGTRVDGRCRLGERAEEAVDESALSRGDGEGAADNLEPWL